MAARLMRRLVFLFLAFAPLMAEAQTQRMEYFRIQSGSGFFVSPDYAITNAHVVKHCQSVYLKSASASEPSAPEPSASEPSAPEQRAEVLVTDEAHDLALLRPERPAGEVAPLRFNIDDIQAGADVLVVGFPGEEGIKGEYKVMPARVEQVALDAGGKSDALYISDVLEHGNSGGPVFDMSGNVIGVVVAKTVLTTMEMPTRKVLSEQHLGVAISLATVKQFLFDHGVFAQWNSSGLLVYPLRYIEDHARLYIVNVQCRIPTDADGHALDGSAP
jgi:S1-C subfamily serine protease